MWPRIRSVSVPALRAWREKVTRGRENIPCASIVPATRPAAVRRCRRESRATPVHLRSHRPAKPQDSNGPEMDPKARINATSAAPVAMVFASSARATLPPGALRHYSRADDGCNQRSSPEKLRDCPRLQIRFHCWPILSTSLLRANLSMDASGRERNRPMRRSRIENASR
jgi:hypothetical protein